jgi:tricarballylate dehydrogenase
VPGEDLQTFFDVLVIGGGNAGLSAAIMAAEAGRSVCILEAAPRVYRGGNSRHTRNLRAMHAAPTSVLTEAYDEAEYYQDLLRVTKGRTTETLSPGWRPAACASRRRSPARCTSGAPTPSSSAAAGPW